MNALWDYLELGRIRLQYGTQQSLDEFPDWRIQSLLSYIEAGDAVLAIYAPEPGLMVGQDPAAVAKLQRVTSEKKAPVLSHLVASATNWCVISGATAEWAVKVFPGEAPEAAEAQLWDTIFDICRVKTEDPLKSWQQHVHDLETRAGYLEARNFKELHFIAPDTDLRVGIPGGHRWTTTALETQSGIRTMANIPSEEVNTLPHRENVNGFVRATKPLSYGGTIIENFTLTFEDGRVINATAEKGEAALKTILAADEAARSLGEIALVPHSSPVSKTGLLFYSILYDENSSTHLALGRAYRSTMRRGTSMTDEEFQAAGGNQSRIHVDFMIGSAEMDVDGLREDGTTEAIMRAGEWAFDL